jgi:3-hydroxybutyryl-CoA dehydrogenase
MSQVNVAVLGTGMMGPGIAVGMARAGHPVALYGRTSESLERGFTTVDSMLGILVEGQVIARQEAAQARSRISGTTSLEEATAPAAVVCESIVEDLDVKRGTFEALERYVGDETILSTNTSGLPITQVARDLRRPERALTAHFWNPPHLMPLVEIVKGERTADEYVERMRTILREADWSPVVLSRDVPGQLGNRLQHAIYREAFHIIQEGIASAEDVDIAIKNGPGLRWPVYGLIEHADMVGLDMMDAIDSYLFAALAADRTTPPVVRERVAKGDLGVKSGRGFFEWTDERARAVRAVRDRFLLDRLKERLAARPGRAADARAESVEGDAR